MSVRLDEQRAIISDYQRADQAARGASERKDEFLAILVHELRNPLAALASAAHTLEKTEHRGEAGVARRRDGAAAGRPHVAIAR